MSLTELSPTTRVQTMVELVEASILFLASLVQLWNYQEINRMWILAFYRVHVLTGPRHAVLVLPSRSGWRFQAFKEMILFYSWGSIVILGASPFGHEGVRKRRLVLVSTPYIANITGFKTGTTTIGITSHLNGTTTPELWGFT